MSVAVKDCMGLILTHSQLSLSRVCGSQYLGVGPPDATITLRRRVNARRESARIAAEAKKHGIRGTSCMRTCTQTRHTCSRISRRKLRKLRFRLGGGLDGFFK